jgi:hypothetical protein
MKQQIEPAYATFEQSKKLKEKGFDVKCESYFLEDEIEYSYPKPENWNLKTDTISCPEQWQIVEWLRINHGIEIYLRPERNARIGITTYYYGICTICSTNHLEIIEVVDLMNSKYPTPQEAYSAAFDYILNELI